MADPRTQLPTLQEFLEVVNTRFEIRVEDGEPVDFTLVKCDSVISNEQQECYSLLFRGPAAQPPVQAIYSLKNDQLGRLELLLVPVKRDEDGLYFEAVINHLLNR